MPVRRALAVVALGATGACWGLGVLPLGGVSAAADAMARPGGSVPPLPPGSHAVGALPGADALRVDVVLRPRHPAALQAFAAAVSTPSSPLFRQYLRRGQFAGRFGPAPSTVAATRAWLAGLGVAVGPTEPDGLAIPVSGTVAQIEHAFGLGIEQYRLASGRVAHAPTAEPLVPRSLAGSLQGVVGLADLAVPTPQTVRPGGPAASARASGAARAGAVPGPRAQPRAGGPGTCTTTSPAPPALTAGDLAQAYSFSSLYTGDTGQGVHVGVYELESFSPSDIATFAACYGVSNVPTVVPVDGGPEGGPAAGSGEAALDIEMVIGMAPGATVDVYEGPENGSGPYDVYDRLVDDDADRVISTSWGQCEPQSGAAEILAENALFERAAAQGQTVTAAAGDEGSTDCFGQGSDDLSLEVDDPASQPDVTAAGGTVLGSLGPPPSESVWNSGLSGAGGGGISSFWTMPSWQRGPGVQNPYTKPRDAFTGAAPCPSSSGPGTLSCREVPDVSSDADPATGYAVYCSCGFPQGWQPIGGTSMASPLWAALAALADEGQPQPVGLMGPALYQAQCSAPATFNDVTTGDNEAAAPSDPPFSPGPPDYPATAGYDLASGLGTPNAPAVVAALRSPPDACPTATGASASSGPTSGGTVVTVTGRHLGGVTEVDFGDGNPGTLLSVSASSVTVAAPPSPSGGWAATEIIVKSADDTLGFDGSLPFTYRGASGYRTVASDGGMFSFGQLGYYGSMGGTHLNQPVVGLASTPSSNGYWEVASDGGIFAFGDAGYFGSMGGTHLNQPVVAMASTPDGRGYWEVASDGGIFAFGDAGFYGSMGGVHLNRPVVAMAVTPDGGGYFEVASDGGIFAFGDAAFSGSMGGVHLNEPVVGMATTPDGGGYFEVASDGGIFAFGDAAFAGSMGGVHLNRPVVGMAVTPSGHGYFEVASDGGIFAFGDAAFAGSMGGVHLNEPMVGIAAP